jgi:hypothetical protein
MRPEVFRKPLRLTIRAQNPGHFKRLLMLVKTRRRRWPVRPATAPLLAEDRQDTHHMV